MSTLHWQQLRQFAAQQQPFVLVTVGKVRGSSPRESGAKMLLSANQILGTIGGGNLEYAALQKARQLLVDGADNQLQISNTPLAARFDQCCGGQVQLIFEKINPQTSTWWSQFQAFAASANNGTSRAYLLTDTVKLTRRLCVQPAPASAHELAETIEFNRQRVVIFGAGHVARALIKQLVALNLELICVDQRHTELNQIAAADAALIADDGLTFSQQLRNSDFILIMTHSHQLDFALCQRLLSSGKTFDYVGLIGSQTKKRRFARQFQHAGFDQQQQNLIHCPIGTPAIQGKTPELIALSVTSDLIQRLQNASPDQKPTRKNHV